MKIRTAVQRDQADKYVLLSLVAFAVTVIVTRAFLQLTGFPQVGNSVLHIAHALWGGLLLIVAAYLPVVFSNRWAIGASALLGGVGIGLFIDEVGKFITQANDYFFPPALPIIYGFVLLNILIYLYFRRPPKANPRQAMYHVFEGLQAVLDGDLDTAEAARIDEQLEIARQSERAEIAALANVISEFLHKEEEHLPAEKPDFWTRLTQRINAVGLRVGQERHRLLVSIILIGWTVFIAGYIFVFLRMVPNLDPQVLELRVPLIVIQTIVGILLLVASFFWLSGRETIGLKLGISGFLVSLIALQLFYFYISQFMAITLTLLQLAILIILLAYRNLYILNSER